MHAPEQTKYIYLAFVLKKKKKRALLLFHFIFIPMLKINLISNKLMETEMFEQEVNC